MAAHLMSHSSCNLIPDRQSVYNPYLKRYSRKLCLDHDLVVCHCGAEIGQHEGTDSRAMFQHDRTAWERAYYLKNRDKKIQAVKERRTRIRQKKVDQVWDRLLTKYG